MSLPLLLVLGIACYSAFGLLVSRTTGLIDPYLSATLFNGLGMGLPLTYLLLSGRAGGAFDDATLGGVLYSAGAGVAIAAFSILLIWIFDERDVSYAVPVIYGGTVALASLVGWLVFDERVGALQLAGIATIVVGVGMVAVSRAI